MAQEAMRMVGIDELVEGLKKFSSMTPETVFPYLQAHRVRPESLRPYLYFSPGSYTRNLIFKNDLFELIAICWEPGQASRIHNHRDQQCWMAVPIGKLKTQNFRVRERDPARHTCQLESTDSFLMTPSAPGEVDREEPVHQVLNLAEFGERAVSLHIYSRPFNSCEVYSLEQGTYQDVPLHYTSEYGKVCQEEAGHVRH